MLLFFLWLLALFLWLVVPVVINKSSEARFDWIKPYLREVWALIFALFIIYNLFNDEKLAGAMMKLHNKLSGPMGYFILFMLGGIIFVAYWWFIGKMFHESLSTPQKTDTQSVVIQQPLVGNLKQRAIDLSDEIMEDLYRHGWPHPKDWSGGIVEEMPSTSKAWDQGHSQWVKRRSDKFKHHYFTKVFELRNEFAALHLKDPQLEQFFESQDMIAAENRKLIAAGKPPMVNDILPQTIEEVASRLNVLAGMTDQMK